MIILNFMKIQQAGQFLVLSYRRTVARMNGRGIHMLMI